MKVFICSSKHFYGKIPPIKDFLEKRGHEVTLPNSYDEPFAEELIKQTGSVKHALWKAQMINLQNEKIEKNDAILVLNFEKNGQFNYVGGATFLEMFKAWERGKKIFLYNEIPEGMLKDEICAFNPIVISGDLTKIGFQDNLEVE